MVNLYQNIKKKGGEKKAFFLNQFSSEGNRGMDNLISYRERGVVKSLL